jgi:cytoskeletal protein RodZ
VGSLLHPVGSLPPSAYWLRRLLVLLVVVAVGVGAWWLLGGFGSGKPSASTTGSGPGGSGSPSSSATSRSASTSPSHTPSGTPSAHTSTSTALAVSLCPDSAIGVLALTSETSFPAGAPVRLAVEVTNHSATACKRDVGQVAIELVVSSGSARVWSSDDCNPGGGHALVTLRPGQTFATTVTWDRQESVPGCPSGEPKATAGHYALVARNLALKSAPALFVLG